ncbi:MAG: hypothetical protein LC115_09300 [Bacteroidia bacterium]|nr:hypothetical protein [Bacteroidia bacterium]
MKINFLPFKITLIFFAWAFAMRLVAQMSFQLGETIQFTNTLPDNAPKNQQWKLVKPLPTNIELVYFQVENSLISVKLRSFRIDSIQKFELYFGSITGRDTFLLNVISPEYHFVSALTPSFKDYEGILYWYPIEIPIPWERWIVVLGVSLCVLIVIGVIFKGPLMIAWKRYKQKRNAYMRVRYFDTLLQEDFPQKLLKINNFWKKELSILFNVPFQSLTSNELAAWSFSTTDEHKEDLVKLLELEEQFIYAGQTVSQIIFEKKCQTVRTLLGVTEQDHDRYLPKGGNEKSV